MPKYKIAVLDDYQKVALESAEWSVLRDRADIAVFQNHLADPDAVIERLLTFDVVCVMREQAYWITGRVDRGRFRNEPDCLEPENDFRGRQGRGRNSGL